MRVSIQDKVLIKRMNDNLKKKEEASAIAKHNEEVLSDMVKNADKLFSTKEDSNVEIAHTAPAPAYEMVNHPKHYNNYDVEVLDMMERIWGKEATAMWCKMTAFKYRMRMGTKPGAAINQDLDKETFYLNKAKELLSK